MLKIHPYVPASFKRHKHTDEASLKEEAAKGTVRESDPKKLVNYCLMMGFSGSNYYGMQYQQTEETIEGALFKALLKCKWIKWEWYKKPDIIRYQQASRTDKGVSATRQCCSIYLRK